jgi:hypothetical protein
VEVPVQQYRTVLCAEPDTLRVSEIGGNITLCQFVVPGTRPLEWEVRQVTPAIQLNNCTSASVPCLTVRPMAGTLQSDGAAPVISLRPTRATPRVPYTLRIDSPRGYVDVVVIPTEP